jgi:hypothetical protein
MRPRPRGGGSRRLVCRLMAMAALATAGGVVSGVATGAPAGAVAPSKVAYWVKGGVPLPTVPAGGLLVANDPTSAALPQAPPLPVTLPVPIPTVPKGLPAILGPTAVSALIIDHVTPSADATLTLVVGFGSLAPPPGTTTLVACPILSDWTPPAGGVGEMSKAPAADCSSPSTGRVASDMKSISWLLPASFQSSPGTFSIELAPNPTGQPVPFAVPFVPPGPNALLSAAGGPATPAAPTATAPAVSAPLAGPADLSLPASLPAPYVAAPTSRAAPGTPRITLLNPAGVRLPGVSDDRGHRIMAVTALFVLAAGWWWLGSRPVRGPRLLGALANDAGRRAAAGAARTGGIGRFARVRHLQPRRL